jgi:non-ribosomal peptide synthetase component F
MTISLPEPRGYPGNLGLLIATHAHKARTAIVDLSRPGTPRDISFRELDATCNALARGLLKAGLKPGDRIGILSLNRVEFVVTLLGAMRAGVVPVPVNIKLPADTVSYILNDAGAALVFAERGLRHLCPDRMKSIEFEGEFQRFLDAGPFEAFDPQPDSVAIQPYTSGSTGRPKGVLLTHYGQNWSRRILAHTRGTTEKDVILVAAPLYHKNALNAIKQGLTAGATLPLLPQFDIERYIERSAATGAPLSRRSDDDVDVARQQGPARAHRYLFGTHGDDGLGSLFATVAPGIAGALSERRAAGGLRRDRGRAGSARPPPRRQAAAGGLARRTLCRHRGETCRRRRA